MTLSDEILFGVGIGILFGVIVGVMLGYGVGGWSAVRGMMRRDAQLLAEPDEARLIEILDALRMQRRRRNWSAGHDQRVSDELGAARPGVG